ncbi:uncharacterized protein si:dkey-237j10.2 [Dunckerocampus dactyliophorus]|uniref:uncharacterized protein si:dkey-237j10.2 n=1 Tax=Dunckerocampus dactyliophorus TaxID=161453 RepID=UPI0024071A96|nr:uncharacterized protein si:dkey-237j10.2 [Dunckerocampus dactyliophorus]
MLGESFLRVLCYKEEKKCASMGHTLETSLVTTQTDIQQRDADQQEWVKRHGVREAASGLSIPGCSSVHTPETDMTLCSGPCSLLDHYPDLQVVDSGLISHNTLRTSTLQQDLFTFVTPSEHAEHKQLLCMSSSSLPDQGYLVMSDAANTSLGVPASQLEPMSNSLLNGLLEKQLEEVYLQHLTDNLARCNSHLGNSLLHGLVPPLQPSDHQQDCDLLESNMEEAPGGERGKKLNYLSNLNLAPCSSNFSTPVLRISENVHPQ